MGTVRRLQFDAVIGVGGKSREPVANGLALKVNWIGKKVLNRKFSKRKAQKSRGPLITFKQFILWEELGPDLRSVAPTLYKYMFDDHHVRYVMSDSRNSKIQREIAGILAYLDQQKPCPTPKVVLRGTLRQRSDKPKDRTAAFGSSSLCKQSPSSTKIRKQGNVCRSSS